MPYWVGVKNELSVTWFTNVNFHLGVVGKLPATAAADSDVGRRCLSSMNCTPRSAPRRPPSR